MEANPLQRLRAVIEKELAGRKSGLGAQAFAFSRGEILINDGFGETLAGQPLKPDTLHQVWCLTKPLSGFGLGLLADAGRLDLRGPIDPYCADISPLIGTGITPCDLLNHRAGLLEPPMVAVRPLVPERRTEAFARLGTRDGRVEYPTFGYSDYAAWRVIEHILDDQTGDARAFLHSESLRPLGLDSTYFGMLPNEHRMERHRIGTYFAGLPDQPVPLLHDYVASVACDGGVAFGGYSTMADIGHWFYAVQRVVSGSTKCAIPGLPTPETTRALLQARRGRHYDVTLERECDFAAGCMVNLRDHHFGSAPSERAFGIVGWHGASFALADPDLDLAAGILFNGMTYDFDAIEDLRRRVVDALYADLDAHGVRSNSAAISTT